MSDTLELRKIEELLTKPPQNIDVDFIYTNKDRDPAWLRFLKGAYDMPITWWTGIIHSTMLAGIWGSNYKSAAQVNQKRLDYALEKFDSHPDQQKIINTCLAVAWYNKEYFVGRFAGGMFVTKVTNSLLKRIPFLKKYTLAIAGTSFAFNFSISSFGAALISVASGYSSTHDVIYSIITGTAQRFPLSEPLINIAIEEMKKKAEKGMQDPNELIALIEVLNDIQPNTMKSYDEWCKDNPDQAADAYFCQ
ncbi:MAG: hypothetical protein ACRBBR_14265 [Cellvibrionaceae bacterium]